MKKKVLSLIEELNSESDVLTDDPDIAEKFNEVCNQILYEVARMKKIPKYVELDVEKGNLITFSDLETVAGNEIYQVALFGGVANTPKANGTVFKILESGAAEVECFVYPKRITTDNESTYTFEVSPDVLEIMPYGIAGDLLKSDVSAEYGTVYSTRYEAMLQRLDPRNQMTNVYIEGGVDI